MDEFIEKLAEEEIKTADVAVPESNIKDSILDDEEDDYDELSDKIEGMKKITSKERKDLPDSAFALPGRKYPIHDIAHARNALARVAQNGTPEEQEKVKAAVHKRYPELKPKEERMENESKSSDTIKELSEKIEKLEKIIETLSAKPVEEVKPVETPAEAPIEKPAEVTESPVETPVIVENSEKDKKIESLEAKIKELETKGIKKTKEALEDSVKKESDIIINPKTGEVYSLAELRK